ncbi:MAG: ABC transporter ATP-binding protein [Rhodospirillales bacterium]|jgi:branched-chain amino acid transport system ATP-binding protein|nr:ABC transporter ATP-binding protein [Rhodospirillales bacterium]|tara:strand:- start:35 stop:736 length:702 start_codon:yes stop_codon:yes gene_type:complete
MLLEVEGLDVRYGRNHAVKTIDLIMEDREIVTVLGSNGAGKSSLLKAIQGTERSAGRVIFDGADISGWSAPKRVQSGLVMVPEGRQIFVSLTVHENLQMGAYCRSDNVAIEIDAVYERFPNLKERRHFPASVLSGGEQQMLAIGRALLARPKLMMLDEPSLGLSPILVKMLFEMIENLNQDGLTILLVEQNTHMALQTAHRGYVLELGNVALSGPAATLQESPRLEEVYLGLS